jgi:arylsulfatase
VLHITGGRLIYEQSLLPWSERIESAAPLPDGDVTVRYVQTMTARPFEGRGALFVNGTKVAEHTFTRTLVATSYDGFSLGADLGNRVSTRYHGPHAFQGRIVRVTIDIDTTPFSTLEQMRFVDALGIRV